MILEMDCGNSFIKWRVLCPRSSASMGGGTVAQPEELLQELDRIDALKLSFCRFVSVRSEAETLRLAEAVKDKFNVKVSVAASSAALRGVVNGYEDFSRLGMDRWLALVAAYNLSGRACAVFDLGTAVTCDLVTSDGRHLGGYICPGIPLMRSQLQIHTSRIRYDQDLAAHAITLLEPGRNTVEAVERGCVLMMRSFVATQVALAAEYIGANHDVYLTGGDALVAAEAVVGAHIVPDLVFQGLALACPVCEED